MLSQLAVACNSVEEYHDAVVNADVCGYMFCLWIAGLPRYIFSIHSKAVIHPSLAFAYVLKLPSLYFYLRVSLYFSSSLSSILCLRVYLSVLSITIALYLGLYMESKKLFPQQVLSCEHVSFWTSSEQRRSSHYFHFDMKFEALYSLY